MSDVLRQMIAQEESAGREVGAELTVWQWRMIGRQKGGAARVTCPRKVYPNQVASWNCDEAYGARTGDANWGVRAGRSGPSGLGGGVNRLRPLVRILETQNSASRAGFKTFFTVIRCHATSNSDSCPSDSWNAH